MEDMDDLIDRLQAQIGLDAAFFKVCQFMLAYLSLIKAPLPPIADAGILTAEKFSHGNVSAVELENARIACWKFLEDKGASTDVSVPENCAVRAVICCLHSKPEDEDLFDLLSWFLELARKVEDHSSEIPSLAERFLSYPDTLGKVCISRFSKKSHQ